MTGYLTDRQIADAAIRGMAVDRAVELVQHGASHEGAAQAAGVTRDEVTAAIRDLVDQGGTFEVVGTTEPGAEPSRADELLRAVRDGAWLDGQTFPPLRYAVPGLLPEGFTLLIGPPKAGKSWLILGVLLALSTGGTALGRLRVPKGRVLYLALEDGDRRMQDRARNLMDGEPLPPSFHYVTAVGPMDVLATIEAFMARYPDTVLVVLDTLGKVMPPAFAGETTYSRDYRVGGRIKLIADQHPGLAVVALHHDRKAVSDDFVDRVSGTNGLAGAADTILVLSRERHADEGTIAVTGRDVIEAEYALTMAGGTWALDGRTLAEAAQKAATVTASAGLGDSSAAIMALVTGRPNGVRAAEVAAVAGLSPANAKDYLARLWRAGRIAKSGRGLYTPVASVATVAFEEVDATHATDATPRFEGEL